MIGLFVIIMTLLVSEEIQANKVRFVALFYIDLTYITILTLAVLFFR